jgi:hypothetical protein
MNNQRQPLCVSKGENDFEIEGWKSKSAVLAEIGINVYASPDVPGSWGFTGCDADCYESESAAVEAALLSVSPESTIAVKAIAVHDLSGMTPREAYAFTQTEESVKDGHILNLGNGNVAILVQAWPVMVTGDIPNFHHLGPDHSWEEMDNGKYFEAAKQAKGLPATFG